MGLYCIACSLLQCEYSPHAIHWIVGLPVPKFLDVKSFLGPTAGPVEVPGWSGASEVDFLVFLPLLDIMLARLTFLIAVWLTLVYLPV